MTTNKPGSVNQQPLYGCTNCYEDWTWPAGDLRVHDSECWCDPCWDERRWEFPDQPCWNDLEPYTPALQAECERLRKAAEKFGRVERCMEMLKSDEFEGSVWTACTLLLIGSAHKLNSTSSVVTQEGVTVEDQDVGDWRVTVERIS